ncbi:MAG: MutS-related protein, partial [Gaiellaceae bacterium]
QFYLAYLEHVERIEKSGLTFCRPDVSSNSRETAAEGLFDLALAGKLAGEGRLVVRNDLSLRGPERILIVTGPNQGGKTTFARAFGQLHHLAGLGLPVPAASARVFLADAIFAHFERAEDMTTLRGKLDDELVRVRQILEDATGDSVVVVNEIFASTSLDDAIFLGAEILRRLVDLDCLAVCVTFVDELATFGPATVSMVAAVEPDDPSTRTFRIERRPADGRAYAWALAEKYGLSYDTVRRRLSR